MSEPTGPQTDGKQPGLLERYRQRYPWLDHLVRAGETYTRNNGDHYAAAITYFSVLSLVPLLMIAFAVAGFVLAGNQQLLSELQEQIRTAAPAELGGLLNNVIEEAIASRSGVGIVGLLVALYSGLGWMSNLREALTAQWTTQPAQQRHEPEGFLRTKLVDLLALLGLGLALLVSFGITGAGTAFAGVLLDLAGLGDVFGARLVFYVLAIVLSLGGMWLVFLWVITRLPREPVSLRSAMWAAVLAAIGFELLKQVFALYLDSVSNSPTGRLFGPVIGLMVFAYFVSRFLLFVTAWAAASTEHREQEPPPSPSPAVRPEVAGRAQGNP
ncbi:MAG: inner membrane protein YhjD [Pseudonocardiaceae bacterium]